jgi:acylphosphatase
MELKRVNVLVSGRVQGVGYRYFALEKAMALGLKGWVRNLPNGDVEALAEGPHDTLIAWLAQLERGPALAHVARLQTNWRAVEAEFTSFHIH